MMGILVIALPITVIGSNFSAIYSSIGTSQSLAKEHEPSAAASRAACCAAGAAHRRQAHRRRDGRAAAHEWDLDVAFDELLPCAAPALVANGNDGANDPGGDARDSRASLESLAARSRQQLANGRRSLTPEQQIEAFLKGEDLHENPLSARGRGIADAGGPRCWRRARRKPRERKVRLGVRDLSAAREAKDEKDKKDKKGKGGSEKSRKAYVSAGSVPIGPGSSPEGFAQVGPRAQAALCARGGVLADCVRNPEVRDKFAATRSASRSKKETRCSPTRRGAARTNDAGPKSRASLERKVGETDVSSVARRKSLRVPKTPQPTPGVSFATPRTEEGE